MRLFIAAWPSPDLVAALELLDRPERADVRWTTPDQWHVTLRFIGPVPDEQVGALADALAAGVGGGGGRGGVQASAGPAVQRLGRGVACLPVAGLDGVAASVGRAVAPWCEGSDHRPFQGHLTVARARGDRRLPTAIVGQPVVARWTVEQVDLVASDTHPDGARYRVVRSVPLG